MIGMESHLKIFYLVIAGCILFCGYWVYSMVAGQAVPSGLIDSDARWVNNNTGQPINQVAGCAAGNDGNMHCPVENVTNYFSECQVSEDGNMYCEVRP